MNDAQLYKCIFASILKLIVDFRTAHMPGATFLNWDAHAQPEALPPGDLIGPAGVGMATEESGTHVVFSVGIATTGDPNLFRLVELMSALYGRLSPQMTLPIYDADTAEVASWMVVRTPTAVLPVSKAQLRTVQFINVTALIDPGATSPLRNIVEVTPPENSTDGVLDLNLNAILQPNL